MCACRACRILFDRSAAGGGHYRLIPDRRLRLAGFELDDAAWEELRIPVDMAFFFHSSAAERVVAFYPGPMGATESLLELEAWQALEAANPVLASMEPDVEALLVNRARGAREHWLVPIDDCYALVGLIRTRWRGLTGGKEVWEEIGRFFEALDGRSRTLEGQLTTRKEQHGEPEGRQAGRRARRALRTRRGSSRATRRATTRSRRATCRTAASTAERSTGINAEERGTRSTRACRTCSPA